MKRYIICLVSFVFWSLPSWSSECGRNVTDGISWSYCISKVPNSKNPDIVYYLHGGMGDEKEWDRFPLLRKVRKVWKVHGIDPPTVVSFSFGANWLLGPSGSSQKGHKLMKIIMESVIPQFENSIGGIRGKRILVGRSLGGFNASELFLNHSDSFDAVALLCPALVQKSPHLGPKSTEFRDYIKRTHASSLHVFLLDQVRKRFFKSNSSWNSASPFELAERQLDPNSPRLYISIGENDEYGFFEGTRRFVQLLENRSRSEVNWFPVRGKHCKFDVEELAEFIASGTEALKAVH